MEKAGNIKIGQSIIKSGKIYSVTHDFENDGLLILIRYSLVNRFGKIINQVFKTKIINKNQKFQLYKN